jgi:ribose transport system substrate-binding protein
MKMVVLVMMALLALPATLFGAGGKERKPSGQIVVGLTLPDSRRASFTAMKNDVEATAAQLGVKVVFIDAQNDPSLEIAAMKSFISRKVNGILLCPISTDSLVPAIENAAKAGVPVATMGSAANTNAVLVHVGADDVENGRAAARYVVDKLKGRGKVIALEGTAGTSSAVDRAKGFTEVLAQNPGVTVIASKDADFDRAKAHAVMEGLLQSNPTFDAVVGANDEMIIGAIEAMSAAGVDPSAKVTVGCDGIPDALSVMKAGSLGATIDQFPGRQASQALVYLVGFIKDKTPPPQKVVVITPQIVTAPH